MSEARGASGAEGSRSGAQFCVAALGLLLLAGCAVPKQELPLASAGGGEVGGEVQAKISSPPQPQIQPQPPIQPVLTSGATLASLPRPAGIGVELGRLRSLSSTEVTQLIGNPDFRRDEPPAQLWQYRLGGCVLDLFLYPEDGVHRVAYAGWHGRDTATAPAQSCMEQLQHDRHGAASTRL